MSRSTPSLVSLASLVLASLVTLPHIAAADCYNFYDGTVALRWNACVADGGTSNQNFACEINTGTETLVASYVLSTPMDHVTGASIYIDLASSSASFPLWWGAGSGYCRPNTAISVSSTSNASAINCVSPWPASASGGSSVSTGYNGPGTLSIRAIVGVPSTDLFSLPAGVETFCMRILISHAKTLGTGLCGGCSTPVCIALSEVELTEQDTTYSSNRVLCGPAFGNTSQFVTWQNAAIGTTSTHNIPGHEYFYWFTTDMECAAATPVKRVLWGSIKAMYR